MATNNSRAPSSSTKKGAKTAQESCLIVARSLKMVCQVKSQFCVKENVVRGGYTEPVLVCQRGLSKLLENLLTPMCATTVAV